MKLVRTLSLFCTILNLSACSPIYKTHYDYEPPSSSSGRMCTSQCFQNKSMCQQMCQMREEACRMRSRQEASYEYHSYKEKTQAKGQRVKKSINSFDRSWENCNESCQCDETFNMCYENCGGIVTPRQVCVAFCK